MIQITAIPAFKDNYLWMIEGNEETWVVDPGDGDAIKDRLRQNASSLDGILVTHHHWDHVNGIESLTRDGLTIAGPAQDQFPLVNLKLSDGDRVRACGIEFLVLEVPGHTLNHLAYYAEPEGSAPILFCGDTLFAGGCGRLFEGTPAQMQHSLARLSALPAETKIYCAHEYTESNLAFANTLEPDNLHLKARIEQTNRLRQQGIPTIPSTLDIELKTNPFLRADSPAIIEHVRNANPDVPAATQAIFAEIRRMKDQF